MVFNSLTVSTALTPSIIETYFSHVFNRAPLREKPTAHISYHEGLRLIRQFLDYSSKHTVEDLQGFTAQWVPAPHWVRINDAEIAPKFLDRAAHLLISHLGRRGLDHIGGKTWWQWRRPDQPLRAEWIEMKKEYHERKRTGEKCERVILYVHGGAYYFGSVDEHRYQMQRHARKLRARVLAPRYRLAPQFPFPCGLFDCLATYLYLLEHFEPSQILFAGDSAGGGMVLSMLVVLRDQGYPLPAGTILLSPWCDLTHSFPSVAGDGAGDYIPPHGFHHRPSLAWPPPARDPRGTPKSTGEVEERSGAVELPATAGWDMKARRRKRSVDEGDEEDMEEPQQTKRQEPQLTALPLPRFGQPLSTVLDGKNIDLKEQIQMYTTNELLTHPLVSPVMQPSLGGLPPMLIQVGGAELLRDEQIYVAHKAANPTAYPPNETIMDEFDPSRTALERWPPTDVQLQVWDDLCHVPHTLSFTRPAKYMYRSVAQFGAWALAHAQHKGIDIPNDDVVSVISSNEGDDDDARSTVESVRKERPEKKAKLSEKEDAVGAVGKAGDPLPPFKDHMIRQRVTRHGNVFPLEAPSEMACLALDPASIGVVKPGPLRKWLNIKTMNDTRFANEKKKVQKKREKELAAGYDSIPSERPPPTALVNRRRKGIAPEEKKRGKSWGLAMWSGWGSSHDEHTLQREQKTLERKQALDSENRPPGTAQGEGSQAVNGGSGNAKKRRNSSVSMLTAQMRSAGNREQRPMSPYEMVTDTGQADKSLSNPALMRIMQPDRPSTSSSPISRPASLAGVKSPTLYEKELDRGSDAPIPTTSAVLPGGEQVLGSENTFLSPGSSRPHNGVVAYPFRLREERSNPSLATLDGSGVGTPHSELVGDEPKTVELSGVRSVEDLREGAGAALEPKVDAEQALPLQESEDLVSPIEEDKQLGDAEVSKSAEEKLSPPFKMRNAIFDPRTSMLGSIGADGMPNAHHDFPIKGSKIPPALAESKEDAPAADYQTTSTPPPSEPSSETSKAPFKLRNPVYDARARPTTAASGVENSAPAPEPLKPSDSTKAAPFKLRHTYDPATIAAQRPSPPPENAPPATMSTSPQRAARASIMAPEVLRSSAGSSSTSTTNEAPPPAYESMPLHTVTMPETVGEGPRPVVSRVGRDKEKRSLEKAEMGGEDEEEGEGRPPTPPPKDDKPVTNGGMKKGGAKLGLIGSLSFEKEEEQERVNGT